MASPKSELTLYVEAHAKRSIDETIDNEEKINMLRDYWYGLKDDPKANEFRAEDDAERMSTKVKSGKYKGEYGVAHSDESWSKKITSLITKYVEQIAFSNPRIYEQLGLESKRLTTGSAPIVVIFEKEVRQAFDLIKNMEAGWSLGNGQTTTTEMAHICGYLEDTEYSKGYIFVMSDYDPSGLNMYNQIKTKADAFSTKTNIEVIWVEYKKGVYSEYTLTDNNTNAEWIEERGNLGIEFNAPQNIRLGIVSDLEVSMEDNIDKRIFSKIAYHSWRWRTYSRSKMSDKYLQNLIATRAKVADMLDYKIKWREKRHFLKTNYIKVMFEHDNDGYSTKTIKDDAEITEDDAEYFEELLGSDNPYDGSLQAKTVSDMADSFRWEIMQPTDEAIEFYDDYFREDD